MTLTTDNLDQLHTAWAKAESALQEVCPELLENYEWKCRDSEIWNLFTPAFSTSIQGHTLQLEKLPNDKWRATVVEITRSQNTPYEAVESLVRIARYLFQEKFEAVQAILDTLPDKK